MITLLTVITIMALLIPIYVYVGYPILLIALDRIIPKRNIKKQSITPTVSMVVSCYNEIDVIEDKIRNCISLEYPPENIEFLFVSDGSDDGTDEIIKGFDNIKLIRQEGRLGKTMGLNLALDHAIGDVVVFSDANAMYKPDAITMLVRNFSDEAVGYVVGAALYLDEEDTLAGASENIYWKYEIAIKQIESKLHSVVGGDGAIYAIRKSLYKKLDREDINDFVNPIQIILQGYRGIFDKDAICYEKTAGEFDKEGNRKKRIVNRSFSGLMKYKAVMNPFKYGFFAVEILSHKLLRWLVPFFLIIAAVGILILAQFNVMAFQVMLLLLIFFIWFIMLGFQLQDKNILPTFLLIPYYFYLVNFNSMMGILESLKGNIQVTWSTPRETQLSSGKNPVVMHFWFSLLAILTLSVFMMTLFNLI